MLETEIYYLIPFLSGGLLGLLLSFDDVLVNGIAGLEEIYFGMEFSTQLSS